MNVAQETLGFRRAGLSPALSLLMSAFALPIPPARVPPHLRRPTERSPTASGARSQESGIRRFPTSANSHGWLAASWRSVGIHRAIAAMWPRRCSPSLSSSGSIPASHQQSRSPPARTACTPQPSGFAWQSLRRCSRRWIYLLDELGPQAQIARAWAVRDLRGVSPRRAVGPLEHLQILELLYRHRSSIRLQRALESSFLTPDP